MREKRAFFWYIVKVLFYVREARKEALATPPGCELQKCVPQVGGEQRLLNLWNILFCHCARTAQNIKTKKANLK